VFGCVAFAGSSSANYVGNHYIYDRGDVASAIGATVLAFWELSSAIAIPKMRCRL